MKCVIIRLVQANREFNNDRQSVMNVMYHETTQHKQLVYLERLGSVNQKKLMSDLRRLNLISSDKLKVKDKLKRIEI